MVPARLDPQMARGTWTSNTGVAGVAFGGKRLRNDGEQKPLRKRRKKAWWVESGRKGGRNVWFNCVDSCEASPLFGSSSLLGLHSSTQSNNHL